MIYYYSNRRLLIRFLYRFVPTLPFITLALFWDGIFVLGVLAICAVALLEVYLNYKKGYFKIEENQIETLPIIFPKKLEIKEIKSTYVYDNEWTFQSSNLEIRINKRFVRENQRLEAELKLDEVRFKVNQL